jgi:hypothetical protein
LSTTCLLLTGFTVALNCDKFVSNNLGLYGK